MMNVSVLLVTVVAVEFVGRLVSLNATLFAYAEREGGRHNEVENIQKVPRIPAAVQSEGFK